MVPIVALLATATLAALVVQYRISDQDVTTEFFRAHKTISHTGQLLERGVWIGGAFLTILLIGIGAWALRLS
ncbi:MAG TPA: hypothetical protein VLV86_04070, partial [Vicinamibacterales bacterium]|nr:hypothetical protein [Vicinamibacterales bacterium]